MKTKTMLFASLVSVSLFAAPGGGPGGNDGFLRNQAMAEVQRIANQIDVLQSNYDELASRFGRQPKYDRDIAALRNDIDALRGALENLRREMHGMRAEIVADLTKKIVDINKRQAPVPAPAPVQKAPPPPAVSGPCREYVVEKGDTLSIVAQAFNTSVRKIKEMNNLKSDNLRVGQKLIVPEAK